MQWDSPYISKRVANVLITLARNKAEFIELTLESMISKPYHPTEGPWFSGRKAPSKKAKVTTAIHKLLALELLYRLFFDARMTLQTSLIRN
jgi:hypothetical protein